MNYSPLLAPVVALIAWSLLVMLWMAATRIPAMRKAGIGLNRRGGRGINLEGVIPDEVNWKAHNYQHLMEQPTIFYAIVFALILMGMDVAHQRVAGVGLCRLARPAQHRPGDGQHRHLPHDAIHACRRCACSA